MIDERPERIEMGRMSQAAVIGLDLGTQRTSYTELVELHRELMAGLAPIYGRLATIVQQLVMEGERAG